MPPPAGSGGGTARRLGGRARLAWALPLAAAAGPRLCCRLTSWTTARPGRPDVRPTLLAGPGPRLVPLAGGADRADAEPPEPPDVARDRAGAGPGAAVERPAPRDQLAARAGPPPAGRCRAVPVPAVPFLWGQVQRRRGAPGAGAGFGGVPGPGQPGGRRRRGWRAGLVSSSPSAAGGGSGRSRDGVRVARRGLPGPGAGPGGGLARPAAAAAAAPAPAPPAMPAATAVAWPGLRRAHRAARTPPPRGRRRWRRLRCSGGRWSLPRGGCTRLVRPSRGCRSRRRRTGG